MRLKLTIAYDGAPFAGWQSQVEGTAVQDVLEGALRKIAGERVVVHGSGRTDAGVHALGQCAHIETPERGLKPADWLRALNANLPPTVRILACRRVGEDFHARFSARGKIYRYQIWNGPVLPPLHLGRVWHFPWQLDPDRLAECARLFTGRHDFAAFAANRGGPPLESTERTIQSITVRRQGALYAITFQGEGFLYKMVRMLTGAMTRVAAGREEAEDLRQRLVKGGPRWNHVAPAEGLYLAKVLYGATASRA